MRIGDWTTLFIGFATFFFGVAVGIVHSSYLPQYLSPLVEMMVFLGMALVFVVLSLLINEREF